MSTVRARVPAGTAGLVPTLVAVALIGCGSGGTQREAPQGTAEEIVIPAPDTLRMPGEARLRHIRQVTFDGGSAEARFSPDGRRLSFRAVRGGHDCDRIFTVPVEGGEPDPVGAGTGRAAGATYLPDNESILFSSTHLASGDCPPTPDRSMGHVRPIHDGSDIFLRTATDSLVRLTDESGHDGEAAVSPAGDRIVFTSTRDGDPELYTMAPDGTDVRRLTRETGYDGGACFSPDGREIVYTAHHPITDAERADHRDLLQRGLIRTGVLNLRLMDTDGSNARIVLENGASNTTPCFSPDGGRIVFSSNLDDPMGRNFEIYSIRRDGTGLERVTYNPTFDGFPVFSPDGRRLAFTSGRNGHEPDETNVFVAEWAD